ncbi:hypothetical protein F8388_020712 [Cannabis sativa]|uniref:Zinc knuckle CX2CX4HX4C domain-containing protein n=1 Tax=Cannabis sativa TaxID=3483 RepID=A0A7J6G534_CANSA|nr:hypothetical protein F8388_020712 [Cannabis sativa]
MAHGDDGHCSWLTMDEQASPLRAVDDRQRPLVYAPLKSDWFLEKKIFYYTSISTVLGFEFVRLSMASSSYQQMKAAENMTIYEHLPTFYFICGVMGHLDKFCPRCFDVPYGRIVKRYGEWMRVKPVRKDHTIGAKWLKQFMVAMEDDTGNDDAIAVGLVHRSKAREESTTHGGITILMIVEENMGQQGDKCG